MKKFALLMSFLMSILPLLFLSGLFYQELRSATEEQVLKALQREIDIGAQNLSDFLAERRGNLAEWSKSNPLKVAIEFSRPEGLAANLEFLIRQYPVYDWIAIVDGAGPIFTKTDTALESELDTIRELQLRQQNTEPHTSRHFVRNNQLYVYEIIPKSEVLDFEGLIVAKITDQKLSSLKNQIREHMAKYNITNVRFSYEKELTHPINADQIELCSDKSTPLILCAQMEASQVRQKLRKLQFAVGFATLVLIALTFIAIYRAFQILINPFSQILESLRGISSNEFKAITIRSQMPELQVIEKCYNEVILKIQLAAAKQIDQARHQAFNEISVQVAHDIRSPLSALNMVASTLVDVSEDKRLLIRQAIERVNDIANDLLQKAKTLTSRSETQEETHAETPWNTRERATLHGLPLSVSLKSQDSHRETCLVGAILDTIVSEKRIQARDKFHINIHFDIEASYGLFVNLNIKEFKRVISNLINNSIENLDTLRDRTRAGVVEVLVHRAHSYARVTIRDNGTGIPQEVLTQLGRRGFSFGKNGTANSVSGPLPGNANRSASGDVTGAVSGNVSGNGLGIYHAKKTIESFQGRFEVQSDLGLGTLIVIDLPLVESPAWFCDKLILQPTHTVVILDDDAAIHGLWRERFQALAAKNRHLKLVILNFVTGTQLQEWHRKHFSTPTDSPEMGAASGPTSPSQSSSPNDILYLIDYELLKQPINGLELIRQLQIQNESILVTSHYLEPAIIEECLNLGLKQIPKNLAGFVPFAVSQTRDY